jgi:hypothetical protein
MNALLQNARRLIEEAQKDLDAARRELSPAHESREDLTLRAALSHLAGAHACVAGTLHRTAIAKTSKDRQQPSSLVGVLGATEV